MSEWRIPTIFSLIDSKDHIFQSLKETTIVKNRATFICLWSFLFDFDGKWCVMIGLGEAV